MTAQRQANPLLYAYIAALAAGAVVAGVALERSAVVQPGHASWSTLPVFVTLLIAAEYLYVRFRFRGEVYALNLLEAVLAPVVFAFPPHVVVVIVACTQVIGAVLRRNAPVKAAFNIAQWSLGAALCAWIAGSIAPGSGVSWLAVGGLLAGLAASGLFNQTAFAVVIRLAERRSMRSALRVLGPTVLGWTLGWAVNTSVGILFVFAYGGHPWGVALFPVPLAMLHLAYRGYAGARTDRMRLAGLHRAARVLAEPLDPAEAIVPFLSEVAKVFEAPAAALALRGSNAYVVHTVDIRGGRRHTVRLLRGDEETFESKLLLHASPVRVTNAARDRLGQALAQSGWRDCLAVPLSDDGEPVGHLMVYDQGGLEGFEAGELAVLDALGRETVSTLAKGRLLERILEERRRLAEIVGSTSDGIVSIAADGAIESWNRAMETITGLRASEVVGRTDRIDTLSPTAKDGSPVRLDRWADGIALPPELRITDVHGRVHRLSCAYSHTLDRGGESGALVIVARDVTTEDEIEELRSEFGRLARAEAARREVVERLQEALMPAPLRVPGLQVGVCYVSSDPRSPTGGDLYDWVQLANGEIQIAVVDVLGHGVAATKDALAVVHALRLLAAQGCPIHQIVARADEMLGVQSPDLVATVVVARYDERTGHVRLAAGGHPPALRVSSSGGVQQVPAPGGPIGWPGAGSVATAELDLAPGDALVLYTDGLIEASKDILAGEEALVRHARALIDLSAEEMAKGLVDGALAEGTRRDDSVAVVLRRAPRVEKRSWPLQPRVREVPPTRDDLRRWLVQRGIPIETIESSEIIVSELLTNAVRAARSKIEMRVTITSDAVAIDVEDDGAGLPGLAERGLELPDLDAERGRGLFVVRQLADDVNILSTEEGTLVRCMLRFADAPRSEAPEVTESLLEDS